MGIPQSQLPPKVQQMLRDRIAKPLAASSGRGNKYHAQSVVVNGIRFDSKKEARRYQDLRLLQQAGEVTWFLRQVPFDLPGGVVYRLDFLVCWRDGHYTYEDVKGGKVRTKEYRIKKKQVEELYSGVMVEEI